MIKALKMESKLPNKVAAKMMGFIPGFINSSIHDHNDISHLWDYYSYGEPEKIKQTKFTLYQDILSYPGDPDLTFIAKIHHPESNTYVIFYPYAYVVVIDSTGATTVGRMD
jgi:hypothetical protein